MAWYSMGVYEQDHFLNIVLQDLMVGAIG